MPKVNFVKIKLPFERPDCCAECPLCGLIPLNQRVKNSKETHVCVGTHEALSRRGIRIRESKRDKNHHLHRPCDGVWGHWLGMPLQKFPVKSEYFTMYIMPYRASKQMVIKFHQK